MYIVIAILLFGFLIAIHEFGHFIFAKAFHVTVLEYAIGMGPAIFKKTKNGTQYSLRIFPLGGFCAMEGEEEDSDNPHALYKQGFWPKFCIFVAGAVFNILVGFLIMLILYSSAYAFSSKTINGFAPEFFDNVTCDLQEGDTLYSIDHERVYILSDMTTLLSLGDGTYDFVVIRDGKKVELNDIPLVYATYTSTDGSTKYNGYGIYFGYELANFGNKITNAFYTTLDYMRLVRLSLKQLFNGNAGINDLSGPVGIVSTMQEVGNSSKSFKEGLENVLYLGAMIAVNLGVMNLLPLPALDGGKILFLVVNRISKAIFKKEIPLKYETYVHLAGFVLLMALSVYIAGHDIWKLFQ